MIRSNIIRNVVVIIINYVSKEPADEFVKE